jgi:hypothetical protein
LKDVVVLVCGLIDYCPSLSCVQGATYPMMKVTKGGLVAGVKSMVYFCLLK